MDNYKVEIEIDGSWIIISDNITEATAHIILNTFIKSSVNATDIRVVESL